MMRNQATKHFIGQHDTQNQQSHMDQGQFDVWYSSETLLYLLNSSHNAAHCLRYVFDDVADNQSPQKNWRDQLSVLIQLGNSLDGRPIVFIAKLLGKARSYHFIVGLVLENNLMVINPAGKTAHKDFYDFLYQMQEDNIVETVCLSKTVWQQDLSSSGPLCAELAMYFCQQADLKTWLLQCFAKKKITYKKKLAYIPIDLTQKVPKTLQVLRQDETDNEEKMDDEEDLPNTYKKSLLQIRASHLNHLYALTAAKEDVNHYLQNDCLNAPEQVLLRKMCYEGINLLDLDKEKSYQQLQQNLKQQKAQIMDMQPIPLFDTSAVANSVLELLNNLLLYPVTQDSSEFIDIFNSPDNEAPYPVNPLYHYRDDVMVLLWERLLLDKSCHYFCHDSTKVDSLFGGMKGLSQQKRAGFVVKQDGTLYHCPRGYSLSLCQAVDYQGNTIESGVASLVTAIKDMIAWQKAIFKIKQSNKAKGSYLCDHLLLFPYHCSHNHWNMGTLRLTLKPGKVLVIHKAQLEIIEPLYPQLSLPKSLTQAVAKILKPYQTNDFVLTTSVKCTEQQQDGTSCGAISVKNGDTFILAASQQAIKKALKITYPWGANVLRKAHLKRLKDTDFPKEQYENHFYVDPKKQITLPVQDVVVAIQDYVQRYPKAGQQLTNAAQQFLQPADTTSNQQTIAIRQWFVEQRQQLIDYWIDDAKTMNLFNIFFAMDQQDQYYWKTDAMDHMVVVLEAWLIEPVKQHMLKAQHAANKQMQQDDDDEKQHTDDEATVPQGQKHYDEAISAEQFTDTVDNAFGPIGDQPDLLTQGDTIQGLSYMTQDVLLDEEKDDHGDASDHEQMSNLRPLPLSSPTALSEMMDNVEHTVNNNQEFLIEHRDSDRSSEHSDKNLDIMNQMPLMQSSILLNNKIDDSSSDELVDTEDDADDFFITQPLVSSVLNKQDALQESKGNGGDKKSVTGKKSEIGSNDEGDTSDSDGSDNLVDLPTLKTVLNEGEVLLYQQQMLLTLTPRLSGDYQGMVNQQAIPQGPGQFYYSDGKKHYLLYSGQWHEGKWQGWGLLEKSMTNDDWFCFEGSFDKGQLQQGMNRWTVRLPNGTHMQLEGKVQKGDLSGLGAITLWPLFDLTKPPLTIVGEWQTNHFTVYLGQANGLHAIYHHCQLQFKQRLHDYVLSDHCSVVEHYNHLLKLNDLLHILKTKQRNIPQVLQALIDHSLSNELTAVSRAIQQYYHLQKALKEYRFLGQTAWLKVANHPAFEPAKLLQEYFNNGLKHYRLGLERSGDREVLFPKIEKSEKIHLPKVLHCHPMIIELMSRLQTMDQRLSREADDNQIFDTLLKVYQSGYAMTKVVTWPPVLTLDRDNQAYQIMYRYYLRLNTMYQVMEKHKDKASKNSWFERLWKILITHYQQRLTQHVQLWPPKALGYHKAQSWWQALFVDMLKALDALSAQNVTDKVIVQTLKKVLTTYQHVYLDKDINHSSKRWRELECVWQHSLHLVALPLPKKWVQSQLKALQHAVALRDMTEEGSRLSQLIHHYDQGNQLYQRVSHCFKQCGGREKHKKEDEAKEDIETGTQTHTQFEQQLDETLWSVSDTYLTEDFMRKRHWLTLITTFNQFIATLSNKNIWNDSAGIKLQIIHQWLSSKQWVLLPKKCDNALILVSLQVAYLTTMTRLLLYFPYSRQYSFNKDFEKDSTAFFSKLESYDLESRQLLAMSFNPSLNTTYLRPTLTSESLLKTSPIKDILGQCFAYYQKYTQFFLDSFIQSKPRQLNALVKQITVLTGSKRSSSNKVTRTQISDYQQEILRLLAGLVVMLVFRVAKAKNQITHWQQYSPKALKWLFQQSQPHLVQQSALFYLLNVIAGKMHWKNINGLAQHMRLLPSQIVEMRDGEGKSTVVALFAAWLALMDGQVTVLCRGQWEVDQGVRQFKQYFALLPLENRVHYHTLTTFCQAQLSYDNKNISTVLSEKITMTLSGGNVKKYVSSAFNKRQFLLIDGVESLLSPELMMATPLVIYLYHPAFADLQVDIWQRLMNKENGHIIAKTIDQTVAKVSQHYLALAQWQKWPAMKYLLLKAVQQMVSVAHRVYDVKQQAGDNYEDQSSPSSAVAYYRRLFRAFKADNTWQQNKLTLLKNKAIDTITIGKVLFSVGKVYNVQIINYVAKALFGVTGKMKLANKTLAQSEETLLHQLSIYQQSSLPSFYLSKKTVSAHDESVTVAQQETSWLQAIMDAIETAACDRQIIVFFANSQWLERFRRAFIMKLPHATVIQSHDDCLAYQESLLPTSIIPPSGRVKDNRCANIILLTRDFVTAFDRVATPQVEINGGIQVIQTFLSEDKREELHIRQRTARRGQPGSYALILNVSHVQTVLGQDINYTMNYAQLDAKRCQKRRQQLNQLANQIQRVPKNTVKWMHFFKHAAEEPPTRSAEMGQQMVEAVAQYQGFVKQ